MSNRLIDVANVGFLGFVALLINHFDAQVSAWLQRQMNRARLFNAIRKARKA